MLYQHNYKYQVYRRYLECYTCTEIKMSNETSNFSPSVESSPSVSLEDQCIEMSQAGLKEAKEKMSKAVSENDLPKYLRAYGYAAFSVSPANAIANAKYYALDMDMDTYRLYADPDFGEEYYGEQAKRVQDMGHVLKDLPESPGQATVVIQRDTTNEGMKAMSGKVLIRFPEGSYVKNPLNEDGDVTSKNDQIFYLDTNGEVCIDQAVQHLEDSFIAKRNTKKEASQNISWGTVPYTNPGENWMKLFPNGPSDSQGKVEYYDEATGTSKHDAEYVIGALCGNATGINRVRIPKEFIE